MSKFFIIILTFSLPFYLKGQSYNVEVSNDSILIGNYIEVRFTAENIDGKFEAPNFNNIDVISGPNMSSSIEILNGDRSSKVTWSYYIQPNELGETILEPSFLVTEDKTYETEPLILNVYPNPEGIIINPKQSRESSFFDTFDFPFRSSPEKDKKKVPQRSKRKLKRI